MTASGRQLGVDIPLVNRLSLAPQRNPLKREFFMKNYTAKTERISYGNLG